MAKVAININKGTLEKLSKPEVIVGIDLGTTNSLIAYINPENQEATVIKNQDGDSKLAPSIIHFDANHQFIVGNAAKTKLVSNPERTIYSVKRLMGKSYTDISQQANYFGYKIIDNNTDSLVKIQIDDKFYTPIELSALILKELKHNAEHFLQQTVNKAVITVPAYFNDTQRQATRDAGKLAGLEVLRIINEPTAASLAYGLHVKLTDKQKIAVYDLGGGTFDVSILQLDNGIFEVLATNGNTYLGGDDFDNCIVDFWLNQNNISPNTLKNNKELSQLLRTQAEIAKITLSTQNNFTAVNTPYNLNISKTEFEQLITGLVDNTLKCCQNALADAQLYINDIEEIIMVGGSTRVPLVQKKVSQFFNKKLYTQINPDEIVALGAAIQANILAGNEKNMLLLDVSPLSLGIETMGGLMDVIIPRNSKVPTQISRQYTTQTDGQASIKIAVYQGERDLVNDNRLLAQFNLKGIPAMPAGFPKINISFTINADGILAVKAKETRSGIQQTIEINSAYGISEEQMAKMLLDSLNNAQQDMNTRALQEAINEAQQILHTTKKFIEKNYELLSHQEINLTTNFIQKLEESLKTKDKNLIHQQIEALNDFSRAYAERIMNLAIGNAIKGKSI